MSQDILNRNTTYTWIGSVKSKSLYLFSRSVYSQVFHITAVISDIECRIPVKVLCMNRNGIHHYFHTIISDILDSWFKTGSTTGGYLHDIIFGCFYIICSIQWQAIIQERKVQTNFPFGNLNRFQSFVRYGRVIDRYYRLSVRLVIIYFIGKKILICFGSVRCSCIRCTHLSESKPVGSLECITKYPWHTDRRIEIMIIIWVQCREPVITSG